MITQEEAKDFIRRYREVVLDTPAGEVHVCGSKDVYEELIGQGKVAFSPNELIHLQKAAENGSLETIVKIKSSIPGAKNKRDHSGGEKTGGDSKAELTLPRYNGELYGKAISSNAEFVQGQERATDQSKP